MMTGNEIKNEDNATYSITDFMPFSIATFDEGWVEIDSLKSYKEHEEEIKSIILKKSINSMKFRPDDVSELFYTKFMKEQ